MNDLHETYTETGCTPIFRVVREESLLPVQQLIYSNIRSLLAPHDECLSLQDKLRLPFVNPPSDGAFSKFMRAMDSAPEVRDLIASEEVQVAFGKVFDTSSVIQFPISRFRAQFPNIGRSTYNWHQDEGTWYAVKVKDLAHKMPATLWLSLNGADQTNSIELIPYSHTSLHNHTQVEGQGYFNTEVPEELRSSPVIKVVSKPGEGIAFHPLTLHRSIVSPVMKPRYSIDIRYYSEAASKEKYKVDWKFRLKRTLVNVLPQARGS